MYYQKFELITLMWVNIIFLNNLNKAWPEKNKTKLLLKVLFQCHEHSFIKLHENYYFNMFKHSNIQPPTEDF